LPFQKKIARAQAQKFSDDETKVGDTPSHGPIYSCNGCKLASHELTVAISLISEEFTSCRSTEELANAVCRSKYLQLGAEFDFRVRSLLVQQAKIHQKYFNILRDDGLDGKELVKGLKTVKYLEIDEETDELCKRLLGRSDEADDDTNSSIETIIAEAWSNFVTSRAANPKLFSVTGGWDLGHAPDQRVIAAFLLHYMRTDLEGAHMLLKDLEWPLRGIENLRKEPIFENLNDLVIGKAGEGMNLICPVYDPKASDKSSSWMTSRLSRLVKILR